MNVKYLVDMPDGANSVGTPTSRNATLINTYTPVVKYTVVDRYEVSRGTCNAEELFSVSAASSVVVSMALV